MNFREASPEELAEVLAAVEAEKNIKYGSLHTVMAQARKETGYKLGQLTVLSHQTDPYRLDIAPNRADAKWFAEQFERFVSNGSTVHLRGFHYILLSSGEVNHPSGRPYKNEDWFWMSKDASKYARMLGYVPFSRIHDERNDVPEAFAAEDWEIKAECTEGASIYLPDHDDIVPRFRCELPIRQKYRIALIGEKSSLKPILRPIAHRKLQAFRDLLYPCLDAQVYPVAMTLDQVVSLGLPESVIKETEERAGDWISAFHREQTEIDALAAITSRRASRDRRRGNSSIL